MNIAKTFKLGKGSKFQIRFTTPLGEDYVSVSSAGTSHGVLAGGASVALSKTSDAVGYAGGTLSLTVTTLTGCGWSTSSDSGWLVTNNASGNTSATVGGVTWKCPNRSAG